MMVAMDLNVQRKEKGKDSKQRCCKFSLRKKKITVMRQLDGLTFALVRVVAVVYMTIFSAAAVVSASLLLSLQKHF